MRRSRSNRRTADFSDLEGKKYSPELIRQYEDPEYARAADAYEREAMKRRQNASKSRSKSRSKSKSKSGSHSSAVSTPSNHRKKKKTRFNVKILIRNLIILFLILFAIGSGLFFLLTRTFDKVDTKGADFAISSEAASGLRLYRNVAILGVDARADEGYDGSRTDAIIIMSINRITGETHLISVMRDTYLRMEYFDDSMILDKITHAHHYKGGVNTCASLNRSLDLNIDEFVIFNWKSVSDMVDCLGGIDIYVKSSEIADMNKYGYETARNVGGHYSRIKHSGKQKLSGTQAVTYCRIRKSSGGDVGRGRRYKKVVAAVMKKAMLNPTKLFTLSKEVLPNIRTNMSQMQLYSLCVNFPRYRLKNSISFPRDYYSGSLSDGLDYVVPTTLQTNVQRLHEKAFHQDGYQPSETCLQVNQDIINDTGIQ